MKICVTGGAGFIGSHLVDRLVSDGHDVVVVDNFSTGRRENLSASAGHFALQEVDLRDRVAMERALSGTEVVYHQAALAAVARSVENPREVTDVNVTGTLHVLLAAKSAGARRVVFASSSSVYGDTPTLPKHEAMPTDPRSPYAATKAACEGFLTAFRASFGLEGVALRYFNVYGPRQSPRSRYAAVVPRFAEAMARGEPPVIYGDGLQTRDFTFVHDLVDALVLAADAPRAADGPINIGGGVRVSIRALAQTIADVVGYAGEPTYQPVRPGDVRDSLADIRRAEERLGWKPKTSLREGIARVVEALDGVVAPVAAAGGASKELGSPRGSSR